MSEKNKLDREAAQLYIAKNPLGRCTIIIIASIVGIILYVTSLLLVAGPFGGGFWIGVAGGATAWFAFCGIWIVCVNARNRGPDSSAAKDKESVDDQKEAR